MRFSRVWGARRASGPQMSALLVWRSCWAPDACFSCRCVFFASVGCCQASVFADHSDIGKKTTWSPIQRYIIKIFINVGLLAVHWQICILDFGSRAVPETPQTCRRRLLLVKKGPGEPLLRPLPRNGHVPEKSGPADPREPRPAGRNPGGRLGMISWHVPAPGRDRVLEWGLIFPIVVLICVE